MRNLTKYKMNNEVYGKGRLVLATLHLITQTNKKLTLEQLQLLFPKNLQGTYETVMEIRTCKRTINDCNKRYFMHEPITLKDGTRIVVTSQWGSGNIKKILKKLRVFIKITTVLNS